MKKLTIDIETTGLPKKGHTYDLNFMDYPYIVTLAYKINEDETKYFIINQEGREIPKEASDIHKITTEIANSSPLMLTDVLNILLQDAKDNDLCIGHNIYFDTSTIKANILRAISQGKLPQELYPCFEAILHKDKRIDTMMKTIKFCALPRNKWPKLTELYFKLFNEEFNAHNSKDDVDATYKCFLKLFELNVIQLPTIVQEIA